MIENGQVNFIYYNLSKCGRACDLFKNNIDILCRLKKKNIDGSKIIQNCYWGSLCKKKNAKNSINRDDNFIISDNRVITSSESILSKVFFSS